MNLTGKRFQCLTVIAPGSIHYARRRWCCRCDCGNEIEASESKLFGVLTNDCGCGLWRSINRLKGPRKNTYPRPEDRPSYSTKLSESRKLRKALGIVTSSAARAAARQKPSP